MRTRPEASSFKTNHVVRVVRVVQVVIIRSKSNNESLEVYISDFTPRLTAVVLDGFLLRAISEPDLVLPLIFLSTMVFPPKVSSSPLGPALRSSLSRLSSILTIYFSKQTFFSPIFYRTQSSFWAENSFTRCSIDPLFSTFPQHYEMLPLNANTD